MRCASAANAAVAVIAVFFRNGMVSAGARRVCNSPSGCVCQKLSKGIVIHVCRTRTESNSSNFSVNGGTKNRVAFNLFLFQLFLFLLQKSLLSLVIIKR